MRHLLVFFALGLGLSGMSTGAQAACNVRGEFCDHPSWAANAFSHPRDRVPDWVLDDAARRSLYGYSAYGYSDRKYKRYRLRRR